MCIAIRTGIYAAALGILGGTGITLDSGNSRTLFGQISLSITSICGIILNPLESVVYDNSKQIADVPLDYLSIVIFLASFELHALKR